MEDIRFDQIKYQNQYNKEKYDSILLKVPKGQKEHIKEYAQRLNLSVNGYVNGLIKRDMEREVNNKVETQE